MKKILWIVVLFIPFLGVAQQDLELTISRTKAIFKYKPSPNAAVVEFPDGSKKKIDLLNKPATLKIRINADVAAKDVSIKLNPEKSLECDEDIISLPGKTKNHGIDRNGTLTPELDDQTNAQSVPLGKILELSVSVNSGTTVTFKNIWLLETGLQEKTVCDKKPKQEQPTDLITGIAYYDAFELINTREKVKALNILSSYAGVPLANVDDASKHFRNNPFIKDYLIELNRMIEIGEVHSLLNVRDAASSALKSIGGLDVTNIADGFAKFLVKRTKEELNVAFFTKFKEELSKDTYRDLRSIFPQTYRALQAIGDDIYNFQIYIQTLRECFEKDLASILTNLPSVIDNHPGFFNDQPELRTILRTGFYVAQQLQDKKHPGNIIADFPVDTLKHINPNYKAGVQTLKIFSQSLRNYIPNDSEESANERFWITAKQLKALFADRKVLGVYLGLIQEETLKVNIIFKFQDKTDSLSTLISKTHNELKVNIPAYEKFITGFLGKAQTVEDKLQSLKHIKSDSLLVENYYSFFNSTLALLEHTIQIESLPNFKTTFPKIELKKEFEKYFSIAHTTADLAIDINRRNYSSAIVNAHNIYRLIFLRDNKALITSMETQTKQSNLSTQEASQLAFEVKALKDSTKIMSHFYRYGTFMATIVQAESSDEVAAAIEAFALPSGSSRIKRESSFNVSLNAYVGLYTGFEKINDVDKNFKFNSFGVTAPIGVAVSWGARHWSYSIFVSLIDLGAITSYRFSSTTDKNATVVDQVPTIQLKDIFSPGLFISVGIPKSPVSINVGSQLGPNLRTVTNTSTGATNEYSKDIYWRHSISIAVDIPILNFYTRSKSF